LFAQNSLNRLIQMKIICFFLLPIWLFAPSEATFFDQPKDKIYFKNPSFEDTPKASASPRGWNTGTPGSTPDILPGAWGLEVVPQDGATCVGLVTRSDGTTENITQSLSEPLSGGVCYTFSIYLAHLEKYVGFNHPARIRVWGSATKGDKGTLLDTSPLINHSDWQRYQFQFFTPGVVRYLTLEVWYGPGTTFYYNGNILLDNCAPIEKCARA
jgi:hypothetical protein